MNIGIVNDMPLAVEALRRALAWEPAHHVLWVAANGAEAVERCARHTPDVVLMDLIMPVMDGVEATRRIMAETPCAILLVTGDIDLHVPRIFDAMGHGALDVVATPLLDAAHSGMVAQPLLRKLQNIGWLIEQRDSRFAATAGPRADDRLAPLVAIGASAGGPAALALLLSQLPRDFPGALVIVQHVDAVFAAGMVTWLEGESALPVRLARDGMAPRGGEVLMAGTNCHMHLLKSGVLAYRDTPVGNIYRPSIDVFFDSVARVWQGRAVGVLLTGMGRDGAEGLKCMKEKGFLTLAQDKYSCAVYGMPKAAAAIGAAAEVLPLDRMAARLVRFCAP